MMNNNIPLIFHFFATERLIYNSISFIYKYIIKNDENGNNIPNRTKAFPHIGYYSDGRTHSPDDDRRFHYHCRTQKETSAPSQPLYFNDYSALSRAKQQAPYYTRRHYLASGTRTRLACIACGECRI